MFSEKGSKWLKQFQHDIWRKDQSYGVNEQVGNELIG